MLVSKIDTLALLFVAPLAALALAGCLGSNDPSQTDRDDATELARDPADAPDGVQETFGTYVDALQSGDIDQLDGVLAPELRERIASSSSGSSYRDRLAAFAEREAFKLTRALGDQEPDLLSSNVSIRSIEGTASPDVIAASAALGAYTLPKAIYFVRNEDGYRINIQPPRTLRADISTYSVDNDFSGGAYTLSCSGFGAQTISAGATEDIRCQDTCGGFFDGTTFRGQNTVSCDFNTFGVDVVIGRSGTLVCSDKC